MKNKKPLAETLRARPMLACFLLALCPTLLICLLLPLTKVPDNSVLLIVYYLSNLFTLLIGFFGLGCALRAANRQKLLRGFSYIAITSGAYGIALLVASVFEIVYDYSLSSEDLGYTIFVNIASAALTLLLDFILRAGVFLFVYLLFFHAKKPLSGELPLFSLRDRRALAALSATAVLFLFKFIPSFIDTISSLTDEFGPTITQTDIFSIIADYVFLLLSMLIGHVLLGIVQGYTKKA